MNVENYGYWWAVQFSYYKEPLCYLYNIDDVFDKIEEFRFQSAENYYNRVCFIVLLNNSKVQTLITLRFPDLVKRFSCSERKRIKKRNVRMSFSSRRIEKTVAGSKEWSKRRN